MKKVSVTIQIMIALALSILVGYIMQDYVTVTESYIKPIQLIFLLTTIVLVEHYLLYGSDFG